MKRSNAFVVNISLIHSPLVGPNTWTYLAPTLEQLGYSVVIPSLNDSPNSPNLWWQQHIESAIQSLDEVSAPYILVGHSGAGPLLPLLAQRLPLSPVGYFFVDAGILWEPASRLGIMYAEDNKWASEFEAYLQNGGTFPNWTDEHLHEILPDTSLRHELLQSLRPKPLSFFTETIPVPVGWDSVPCGYVQLSSTYKPYATTAQARGWMVEAIDGHHFSMMTHPHEVTEVLIRLVQKML